VRTLGRVAYREAWALQRRLVEARRVDAIPDTLLLLEHEPVVTYGRNVGPRSVRYDAEALAARGVALVETDRGGDATFHGPGQVVGYPICKLAGVERDVRGFVRALEEAMIEVCVGAGLSAGRSPGAPGCWVPAAQGEAGSHAGALTERKIGAIGCRFSRWITHHGFAFNAEVDLAYFDLIVPCGIADRGVTSLAAELGERVDVEAVSARLATSVAAALGRALCAAPQAALDAAIGAVLGAAGGTVEPRLGQAMTCLGGVA
jgi:lipoyl(octanoyl) transferase